MRIGSEKSGLGNTERREKKEKEEEGRSIVKKGEADRKRKNKSDIEEEGVRREMEMINVENEMQRN